MNHSLTICPQNADGSQNASIHLQVAQDALELQLGNRLKVRHLGRTNYEVIFRQMQAFTSARDETTEDECWVLEHDPVFTQGQAGKPEHILDAGDIPVLQTDRGGQVTYHGPGQLVVYVLVDIKRKNLSIKHLVSALEQAAIDTLKEYAIEATIKPGAPGVYINEAKIGSLGLRIRKGRSYHGLSLNVDMDLTPFLRIRPCGLAGIKMVQLRDFVKAVNVTEVSSVLIGCLAQRLQYQTILNAEVGGGGPGLSLGTL